MHVLLPVRRQNYQQPSGRAAAAALLTIHIPFDTHFYWTLHFFITSITGFFYLWYIVFVQVSGRLRGLGEDLLYMHSEVGARKLSEGQQRARHVHRVVDVPVPQLQHHAAPLLLVPCGAQPPATEYLDTHQCLTTTATLITKEIIRIA